MLSPVLKVVADGSALVLGPNLSSEIFAVVKLPLHARPTAIMIASAKIEIEFLIEINALLFFR